MEEAQITRLLINDRGGKHARIYARNGETTFAYHPKHPTGDDAETLLYPDSGGIVYLDGGDLGETLDVAGKVLDAPFDYVMIYGLRPELYSALIRVYPCIDENTEITA
jgi:hypothetical protein